MTTRKRIITGVTLLTLTFLVTLHEGVIGYLLARALGFLVGQAGTSVLAVAMFVAGTVLVLPRDAVGRFIRWGFNGREARVNRVVRESRRRAAPIEVEEPEVEEKTAALPPAHRMRLDDVRGALKQLGYKNVEYAPLVDAMDPTVPFEVLVKGALKKLTARTN